MHQELDDLKMMADMFAEQGVPEVEKICLTAIGALRTVDDLASIVMRLAHALRKAAPDNEHTEKALDYLKRKELIGSPLRETPNAEITGSALLRSPG